MQDFLIVNIDRRQYLRPQAFGDGGGLLEFGTSGSGVMLGLAVLLASDSKKGAKELQSDHPIIGSWSGCRIAIAGSMSTEIFTGLTGVEGKALPIGPTLYEAAERLYVDISSAVVLALCEEPYERRALANRGVKLAKEYRSAARSGEYSRQTGKRRKGE